MLVRTVYTSASLLWMIKINVLQTLNMCRVKTVIKPCRKKSEHNKLIVQSWKRKEKRADKDSYPYNLRRRLHPHHYRRMQHPAAERAGPRLALPPSSLTPNSSENLRFSNLIFFNKICILRSESVGLGVPTTKFEVPGPGSGVPSVIPRFRRSDIKNLPDLHKLSIRIQKGLALDVAGPYLLCCRPCKSAPPEEAKLPLLSSTKFQASLRPRKRACGMMRLLLQNQNPFPSMLKLRNGWIIWRDSDWVREQDRVYYSHL